MNVAAIQMVSTPELGANLGVAELNMAQLDKCRAQLPALEHRVL